MFSTIFTIIDALFHLVIDCIPLMGVLLICIVVGWILLLIGTHFHIYL